ncbi:MAG: right-handed parallel beta-helix repeat-containing protein [Clostridia bacterium]|nr:right-handed parallel beta-helix repeat-containing protein [Clostridia bacterium]
MALSLVFGFSVLCYADGGNMIYVSPVGSDSADGSISSPLKTINGAKELAKKTDGGVTVIFREGYYTLDETVCFDSSDKSNVTYRAYPGEKVVFTAGKPYTGFEECTVNGIRAFKKEVGNDADFNVLFNDKTTLKRTRFPEKGYLYVKGTQKGDIVYGEGTFANYVGFFGDEKTPHSMKNEKDVVVRLLHYWKDEMATVNEINSETGHIAISRPTTMCIDVNNRYFFENVFEALNEPGEWYLDRTDGILYYIPEDGESAESLTLYGSVTETMIKVDGVNGISFENIIFRGNGFNIPRENKYSDLSSQAGYDATPCVSYVNADNFRIKNCEFRDIAACAVFIGENVENAEADSNIFENIGAQAVYIRGKNVKIDSEDVTKNITVKNNQIRKYGRVFFNSVGILVIHANSIDILNNEIADGYYTAVSVGWVWGYADTITYNCKICNNLIYNIGQGWLSDMGGIYTLGNQPGTILSGNVIHNVAADPEKGGYGGWGVYLDEGSSEILVEKNLVYSCGNDSYHLHYGSHNMVRNNIFALSGESQVRVVSSYKRVSEADYGDKLTAEFNNNILLTDNGVAEFSSILNKKAFSGSGNILWDISNGENVFFSKESGAGKGMSLKASEIGGYIKNNITVDPQFKDAKNFDFELSENSPVFESGFEKWDYSAAGTVRGSVIGVDSHGGMTAYNASSSAVEMKPVKKPFEPFINLIYAILKFFNII